MTLATMTRDMASGAEAEVLDSISHPETALAIWERDLPAGLGEALTLLDFDEIDDMAVGLIAGETLDEALHAAGYSGTAVAALAADIAMLALRHLEMMGVGRLALRLEVVETDACRRFHADYVTVRTICTYVGPGTQWHRIAEPDAIGTVATGSVAVFKGRLLLDPPTVLHRSPPIMASGGRRLMLVIDSD